MEQVRAAEAARKGIELSNIQTVEDVLEEKQGDQTKSDTSKANNCKRRKVVEEQTWSTWAWETSTMLVPPLNPTMKRGKREEVKILETKDKMTIRRQIILVRRFLKMGLTNDDVKIWDERPGRPRIEQDGKKLHTN